MRSFRLCSLWFSNAKEDFVNRMIQVSPHLQSLGGVRLIHVFQAYVRTENFVQTVQFCIPEKTLSVTKSNKYLN